MGFSLACLISGLPVSRVRNGSPAVDFVLASDNLFGRNAPYLHGTRKAGPAWHQTEAFLK